MTLSELELAVRQALAGGRIGTPVALSMQLHLPVIALDVGAWIEHLVTKFGTFLDDSPSRVWAQQADSGRHWSILVSGNLGRTASFVLAASPVASATVQLLLHGNRGAIELSGNPLESESPPPSPEASRWDSIVRHSANEGRSVSVG